MMSANATQPKAQNTEPDVPQRLVATAIQLWGIHGLHGVSLREITREAEVLNDAAIRYYFDNKQGLLRAALRQVEAEILEWQKALQLDFADLSNQGLEEVIKTGVLPWAILGLENPRAVQFTARMIREQGPEGQQMLIEVFGERLSIVERRVAELLPNKPPKALRLHYFLLINSVLNGICDLSLLRRMPKEGEAHGEYDLEPQELMQGFLEYIMAGLQSESRLP